MLVTSEIERTGGDVEVGIREAATAGPHTTPPAVEAAEIWRSEDNSVD